ncbi:putative dinucleotide-utilizing enzyme [Filimonas zeae]|uniref:Nucleotidyl transferase AbiEii toxin, Type IV TA system n=1 Tax=Filimonas zeae TaxID=1737353 RepID=A0A917MZN9_9BACT|nr:nucleotidyl transferase AbiEii/AbiGii toxin family protein [Filimonas zeae]MDR6342793.1 putative dinucleotide-utilizing enzyme [Filimonas zeae]GGH82729.1 hypothetical protein GCM10011379_57050 [Filimonas zeae]
MSNIQAVSKELLDTLEILQALPSLSTFALAGGTNLALRCNHRESVDLDLFSGATVGLEGMEAIKTEIASAFGDHIRLARIENL